MLRNADFFFGVRGRRANRGLSLWLRFRIGGPGRRQEIPPVRKQRNTTLGEFRIIHKSLIFNPFRVEEHGWGNI
jgi:hypothetical protein